MEILLFFYSLSRCHYPIICLLFFSLSLSLPMASLVYFNFFNAVAATLFIYLFLRSLLYCDNKVITRSLTKIYERDTKKSKMIFLNFLLVISVLELRNPPDHCKITKYFRQNPRRECYFFCLLNCSAIWWQISNFFFVYQHVALKWKKKNCG